MTLSLPYSFVPGTKAKAQEVNANFNSLVEQIDGIDSLKLNKDCSNLSQTGLSSLHNSLTDKANIDCDNISNEGKDAIGAMPMPSASYTDLTLGVTGNKYQAPANGWFVLQKSATAAGQYIQLVNSELTVVTRAPGAVSIAIYIPCAKNDLIEVGYNAAGTTNLFKFIYANGSESEAS